jgi:hypothetical protein
MDCPDYIVIFKSHALDASVHPGFKFLPCSSLAYRTRYFFGWPWFFVWLWTWAGLSGPELLCTPPVLLRLYNLHPPYFDFYYFSSLFAKALLWTLA